MDEYKKKTNTGDDVFVRIQPQRNQTALADSPTPTAVILGWFSSKPKYVAKYSVLYERLGYNTVQTTAPFSAVFPFTPRATAIYFLSILRILASDERLTAGGVVVQLFSNGGAVNAPFLSTMFNIVDTTNSTADSKFDDDTSSITSSDSATFAHSTLSSTKSLTLKDLLLPPDFFNFIRADDLKVIEKVKRSHAALIFDSAPVYLRIELGHRAINEGLGLNGTIVAYFVVFCFTFLCYLQRIFILNLPLYFWKNLRHASYVCPEMYIYSRMDHLLDIPSLEALIEERKQNGKQVRVFEVDDANHVSILRKHPEKYFEVIQSVNEWGINAWRRRNSLVTWSIPEKNTDEE